MKTQTVNVSKPSIVKFLLAGLIAGAIAAALNNLYHLIYSGITGFSLPEVIHFGSITIASILPVLVGALFYFALTRFTSKATLIFLVAGVLFTLISLGGPFNFQLPNGSPAPSGFVGLTLPMHLIAGAAALYFIPKYVNRN